MLVIVSAKNIKDGYKEKYSVSVEEGLNTFFYNYKEHFKKYEIFSLFHPYKDTYLEYERVKDIKMFSESILEWTQNIDIYEENKIINAYHISLKKIRIFSKKLSALCDYSTEHNNGLVGLGD